MQNTDVHINNICVTGCWKINIGSHASKQHIQDMENLVINYHPIKTKPIILNYIFNIKL